jgi:hypothetical protein
MSCSCTSCIYFAPDDPTAEFCLQEENPAVIAFCQTQPTDADMSCCPGFLPSFMLNTDYLDNDLYDPTTW